MALEMTKDTMTWKQREGTHHSRILLEGDMIVPDNRPDVAQVLHCSGTVRLDEVKSGEEKINLTGELLVRVLYRAAGGEKPVYAMTSSLPIQEVLYVEGMTAEDAVNVMAETEHLECQLITDRTVGLRAIVEVWAEAEGSKSLPRCFSSFPKAIPPRKPENPLLMRVYGPKRASEQGFWGVGIIAP